MCRSPCCTSTRCRWSPRAPRRRTATTPSSSAGAQAKVKNVTKPNKGHFAKAKVEPKQKLVEFRVAADAVLEPGATLSAAHFVVGQKVDVVRHHQGQGLCRRHEALELRRPGGDPRRVGQPPFATVRPATARTRARPSRTRRWPGISARAGHHAESGGGRGRCRAGPADGQGRGARREGRFCPGARRGQARRAGGCRRIPARCSRPPARRRAEEQDRCRSRSRPSTTAAPARAELPDEIFGAEPRRRHHGARGALAAGQAPRRHPQDQGHGRGAGHHQEALSPEGHRQRPPGQPAVAAVPHRRRGARAGGARPRATTCPRRCAGSA